MRITEESLQTTPEESAFLDGLGLTDDAEPGTCSLQQYAYVNSLFDKTFPEFKPSSIKGVLVTLYVDGFVFRTPFEANEAQFFAIVKDPTSPDSWKSYHINFEKSHKFSYYPVRCFPFSLRVELWRNATFHGL
jgi:hypothetical protein